MFAYNRMYSAIPTFPRSRRNFPFQLHLLSFLFPSLQPRSEYTLTHAHTPPVPVSISSRRHVPAVVTQDLYKSWTFIIPHKHISSVLHIKGCRIVSRLRPPSFQPGLYEKQTTLFSDRTSGSRTTAEEPIKYNNPLQLMLVKKDPCNVYNILIKSIKGKKNVHASCQGIGARRRKKTWGMLMTLWHKYGDHRGWDFQQRVPHRRSGIYFIINPHRKSEEAETKLFYDESKTSWVHVFRSSAWCDFWEKLPLSFGRWSIKGLSFPWSRGIHDSRLNILEKVKINAQLFD